MKYITNTVTFLYPKVNATGSRPDDFGMIGWTELPAFAIGIQYKWEKDLLTKRLYVCREDDRQTTVPKQGDVLNMNIM